MRPRFMNRGSHLARIASQTRNPSFNEAPIHESGKCALGSSTRRPARGFNEAPIHESGKSGRKRDSRRDSKVLQ